MELALSLGDRRKPFSFMDETRSSQQQKIKELGFCMREKDDDDDKITSSSSSPEPPPLQLTLLPFSPALRQSPPPSPPPPPPSHRPFPWLSQNLMTEPGSQNKPGRELEVKLLAAGSDPDNGEDQSSPNNSNSDTSSFHMDFSSILKSSIGDRCLPSGKRCLELVTINMEVRDGDYTRKEGGFSDDDENGLARKKLRLTKEQSAFLEDSFKEHNTLNPKQKVALAKQLNLRPRQIEVWFQNRRARTKLKQTEVDCEYLKKWCETLNEENKRLQKEVQELRALKTTSHPFYMHHQLPPTTLTMCPSCERVSTTTTSTTSPAAATTTTGRP